MASKKDGVLYTGITNDLIRRVAEHKEGKGSKFVTKYKTFKLVYFESGDYGIGAISREKTVKGWKRDWKIELIEKTNPEWKDLYNVLL